MHRDKSPVQFLGDFFNCLVIYEGRILGFIKLEQTKIMCRKDGHWSIGRRYNAVARNGELVAAPANRDAAARFLITFKETGEKP